MNMMLMKRHLNPVTYISGLFHGSQLNWANLLKQSYAIYGSIKKVAYCLEDFHIILQHGPLPLKSS